MALGGKAYNRRQERWKTPPRAAMIYTTEDCDMEDPAVICLQMADMPERRAQDYPDRYDAITRQFRSYDDPRPVLVSAG